MDKMKKTNIPDDLMTLSEVAAMTALSRNYLYHIYKKQIPHYMFGTTPRFSRKEVLAWIVKTRLFQKTNDGRSTFILHNRQAASITKNQNPIIK